MIPSHSRVISLERTPNRLQAFQARTRNIVPEVMLHPGTDGNSLDLEALSFKYASDLFRLIKRNLNNLQYKDNKELIKVVIDVCAIYANKNHPFSNLIFNEFSKEFLIKNIKEQILHKNHDEQTKIMLTLSVLMSCLGDYLNQEDSITPRCISETKKICLLYLSN